ncbi:MAG: hypothetical protein WB660_13305 [Candidatus Sulfotelmatobacter sp.]
MRSRILLTIFLTALFVIVSGCGSVKGCPVCGTTTADGYAVIDVVPVPEHNPTGEPGGPFNSFDISWVDPNRHLDYVSDRIGLAIVVIDTTNNVSVNAIQGVNAVTNAGNGASACDPSIPPIVSVFGNFTRFGCRNAPFHLASGFGANGKFGGFPGAQCCASRANGINPMSGPDGLEVSDDGKLLFVGNGSSSVVVFDLTTMDLTKNPPTAPGVVADIPTGVSADYDGLLGIAPCVASWNGEAGSNPDCGDDRADEMSYDATHQVLAVINGDPGLPFITFISMANITTTHCLPIDPTTPYGPFPPGSSPATYPFQGSATTAVTPAAGASFNPPSCIIGQIYYDGAGGLNSSGTTPAAFGLSAGVAVDNVGATFACPDPTNPQTFSGVSGSAAASLVPGVGMTPGGKLYTIPCHHGPILDQSLGTFTTANQAAPCGTCAGAIAPAGLGGMAWNPNTGHLLLANENSIPITNIGSIDVIDPRLTDTSCGGVSCGPVVVNSFVMPNCMPTSVTQGPGNNFLIGCADHDGEAFPPNEYVIDGTSGAILATITNVGGVDETWYNPGDNRYYLAARDMPNGPVMGVIDAKTNTWLENVATGPNSHSIAVDPSDNHAFVPLQAGPTCTTQSANGCVGVYAEQ